MEPCGGWIFALIDSEAGCWLNTCCSRVRVCRAALLLDLSRLGGVWLRMIAYYEAAIGLGSNLGDKEAQLRRAVEAMDGHPGLWVLQGSPIYKTPPHYVEDQDWFLNGALWVLTRLEPEDLLRVLKAIEQQHGRQARQRYGPREIDLDILACRRDGEWVRHESATLTLPHPRLCERPFALQPLLDVLPAAGLEDEGGEWLEALGGLDPRHAPEPWPAPPLAVRETTHRVHRLADVEHTEALGRALGCACTGGEVFALCGGLGAGKTAFVRGLARGLGLGQTVQSPTYTLCRDYEEDSARLALHHWDFYRLEDAADVESAGFYESLEDAKGVVAVEWADKFPEVWTFAAACLWLFGSGDDPRRALLRIPKEQHQHLLDAGV